MKRSGSHAEVSDAHASFAQHGSPMPPQRAQ